MGDFADAPPYVRGRDGEEFRFSPKLADELMRELRAVIRQPEGAILVFDLESADKIGDLMPHFSEFPAPGDFGVDAGGIGAHGIGITLYYHPEDRARFRAAEGGEACSGVSVGTRGSLAQMIEQRIKDNALPAFDKPAYWVNGTLNPDFYKKLDAVCAEIDALILGNRGLKR